MHFTRSRLRPRRSRPKHFGPTKNLTPSPYYDFARSTITTAASPISILRSIRRRRRTKLTSCCFPIYPSPPPPPHIPIDSCDVGHSGPFESFVSWCGLVPEEQWDQECWHPESVCVFLICVFRSLRSRIRRDEDMWWGIYSDLRTDSLGLQV